MDRYEIIWKAIQKHGYYFDYRITNSVHNVNQKINYICPKHGIVSQTCYNHLKGKSCLLCYKEKAKKTPITKPLSLNDIIERCQKKNIDLSKFDLNECYTVIINKQTYVSLKCKKCGFRWTTHNSVMQKGCGCPKCCGKISLSDDEYREKLSKLHPELDFSETKYSEHDNDYRIKVICPKHGVQYIKYHNLLNGQGCYYCGREKAIEKTIKMNTEEFISLANVIHNKKYIYDENTVYNGLHKPITYYCPTCQIYVTQLASNHLKGCGCYICNNRNRNVSEYNFYLKIKEYFPNAIYNYKNKEIFGRQSLDVYLLEEKIGIEFQGIQHFEAISLFGGEKEFKLTVERDLRKIEICKNNDIMLFHYTTFKVPSNFNLYYVETNFDKLIESIKKAANNI